MNGMTNQMSSHRSALADLLKAMYGRSQAVYVHLPLLDVVGGWPAAIVFSHLAFWCEKYERPIYKSAPELGDELRMGERTVERAVAHLRKLGILVVTTKRAKGAPTNHYSIDYEKLAGLFGELDPANEAGTDPANEAGTLTEGNTNRRESNPSASDDAGEENASLFTEKESVATSSSAQGSSSAQSSPSSEVVSRARTHANKKLSLGDSRFLELLPALAQAWNANCGRAPKLAGDTVAKGYRPNLLKLVNQLLSENEDPVKAIGYIATAISTVDGYVNGTYGFANATRPNNWYAHYVSGKGKAEQAAPAAAFKVGDKVSWERRPGYKSLGRNVGVIVGFDDRGVPVVKVTVPAPGFRIPELPVGVNLLTKESEDE